MTRLHRKELGSCLQSLGDITEYRPGSTHRTDPDSLFLCALGFEERCLSLPRRMAESGYRAHRARYLQYATNVEDNDKTLPELLAALKVISDDVQPIPFDNDNVAMFSGMFLDESSGSAPPRVTFDISVSSNRFTIRALRELLAVDTRLRIVYSEANVYHPTEAEYRADPERWTRDPQFGTEHGVSEVIALPEFPGCQLDSMPDVALVFPSFKPDRARAVLSFIDPSLVNSRGNKVLWFVGVPHLEEDVWRVSAMREINQLDEDSPQVQVSTFDYKDTLRALEASYGRYMGEYNISVAPFGSKLQSVAVALFCTMHADVRVVSAKPREYGTLFSDGCKRMWELDLGPSQDLRELLASVGDLEIRE